MIIPYFTAFKIHMSGKTKTILDKFGTFRLTERGYVEMKVKHFLCLQKKNNV